MDLKDAVLVFGDQHMDKLKELQPSAGILVVDDNPADQQYLEKILREKGYTVYPARQGSLALKFVQAKAPDLILLDVNMPEMDGYQVCEQLKANQATADIPVIFISAADQV